MDCNINEIEKAKENLENMDIAAETNNNFEPNKEMSSSGGGDIESTQSTQSDGTKTTESREDRIKRLKDKSEAERQRKYTEIIESQKQSSELRQRQQEDRRKKIEELKQREEERKKKVEQRRQEMEVKEKEKNEGLLRRTKEREARAAMLQKQIRMMPTMTQSMMMSGNQTGGRMTTSLHSSGASSGSEKCTKVYNCRRSLSSSGCDVDLVPSYVTRAASNKANMNNKRGHGGKGGAKHTASSRPVPDGFIEVDAGVFIPANTRHAGCFVPYKGPPLHRVKGVLSWGRPPSDRVGLCERGSSVSWWAGIDGEPHHHEPHQPEPQHHFHRRHHAHPHPHHSHHDSSRPASAHASLIGSARHGCTRKESVSPRPQNRVSSRLTTTSTARTPRQPTPRSVITTSTADQSLYDRLSKPRGGSQPPKNRTVKEQVESSTPKSMSSSFTKQPSKTTPRPTSTPTPKKMVEKKSTPPAPVLSEKKSLGDKKSQLASSPGESKPTSTPIITEKKPNPTKRKSLPVSAPDSGLTTSPASEVEPYFQPSKDIGDVSDALLSSSVTATAEDISAMKSNARRQSKNLQNKECDSTSGNDSAPEKSSTVTEEEMYRLKLTEQRRLAREAKEKQQEEQRKIEEEAKQRALAEKKRIEEETRQLIEEEAKRQKQIEEEELQEIERQRIEEEMERIKKEEMEKELEEKRLEKSRTEDFDRMERKRRLEKIMSRVKKPEEYNSISNEECNAGNSEALDTSEIGVETNEPLVEISLDNVVEVPHQEEREEEEEKKEEEEHPMEAWVSESKSEEIKVEEVKDEEFKEEEGEKAPLERVDDNIYNIDSPSVLSDNVLNLPGPSTNSGSPVIQGTSVETQPGGGDQAPQFKSRLLQNMLATGRLANTGDSRRNSLMISSNPSLAEDPSARKRQSLVLSQLNGDMDVGDLMSHSRSYQCDMSKMSVSMMESNQPPRNGLSFESQINDNRLTNGIHRSDTDNEVTLSSLTSNLDAQVQDRGTDLMLDSSCSRLVADERPSPVSSRPLQSS